MIGEPKYKLGDKVKIDFDLGDGIQTFIGDIFIVDAYGTFEQNEEPSYDIMVEGVGLFKHFREHLLTKVDD